jgi:hypothetical protein
MSCGEPKDRPFIADREWFKGDAYWIVKLAFHPEMAKIFKSARR